MAGVEGSGKRIETEEPTKRLAVGIILSAISDYFGINVEGKTLKSVNLLDRREAIGFLYESGPWQESREFWCDLADISPEYLDRLLEKRKQTLREEDTLCIA